MKWAVALGLGAVGGGLVAFGVWKYAEGKLDQQLAAGSRQLAADLGVGSAEIQAQFAEGRAEMRRLVSDATVDALRAEMSRYGVTPERVRQLNEVLAAAERVGLV